MAFRQASQRVAAPLIAGVLSSATFFRPQHTLHADAGLDAFPERKAIYDIPTPVPSKPRLKPIDPRPSSLSSTPTDQLTTQIRHARLFLYYYIDATETQVNSFMTRVFALENSFTQTIASLAPPPETGERLGPGVLYTVVAGMSGSIVVRNRNLLLRALAPPSVGLAAAWYVLPYTMRNVADLVWTYEEKVPVLSTNHLKIKGAVEEGWRQSVIHGNLARNWLEEAARETREAVDGWISKVGQ